MLDVEAALAVAGARVGLVPKDAAESIAAACRIERYDVAAIATGRRRDATPVIELVRQLHDAGPAPTQRRYVHLGATSQDVLDTAMMLVARRALVPRSATPAPSPRRWPRWHRAPRHRQVGRTLCSTGLPPRSARLRRSARGRRRRGRRRRRGCCATGSPCSWAAPWARSPPRETAAPSWSRRWLASSAWPSRSCRGTPPRTRRRARRRRGRSCRRARGASPQDIVLLSSTEVGEVEWPTPALPRPWHTSATRRPPYSPWPAHTACRAWSRRCWPACRRSCSGQPGGWQAEWGTLTDLLRLVGGAARHTAAAGDDLRVDVDRMRAHVDALVAAGGSAGTWLGRLVRRPCPGPPCSERASNRDPRRHLMSESDDDRYATGMSVRREVLGDAYVDRAVAATTEFTSRSRTSSPASLGRRVGARRSRPAHEVLHHARGPDHAAGGGGDRCARPSGPAQRPDPARRSLRSCCTPPSMQAYRPPTPLAIAQSVFDEESSGLIPAGVTAPAGPPKRLRARAPATRTVPG